MIYLEHPETKDRAILSIDDDWPMILSLYEQGYRARSAASNEMIGRYANWTTPTHSTSPMIQ